MPSAPTGEPRADQANQDGDHLNSVVTDQLLRTPGEPGGGEPGAGRGGSIMADRPNNLDLRRSIAQAVATAAARYRRQLRALNQTPGYAPGSSGLLGYPEACRAGFTFRRALRKVAQEIDRRYLAGMRALGAEPSRPLSPDDPRSRTAG